MEGAFFFLIPVIPFAYPRSLISVATLACAFMLTALDDVSAVDSS